MDKTGFTLNLSADINNVSVLNYDATVFSKTLQRDLNPHSAARRHALLQGIQEQFSSLGEEWTVKHATTLSQQSSLDSVYLHRRTHPIFLMECTMMAATLEPSEVTRLNIDESVVSCRSDVLDLFETWYTEHARSLSDQYYRTACELIVQAVSAVGKGAVVRQGDQNPRLDYPNFRCMVEQPNQLSDFAVAFSFISPKKMAALRR